MSMAVLMGLPKPPSYQLCLWLFLWGRSRLLAASYAYAYSPGVAPASQLPAMPMAIPMRLSSLPVTIYAYSYSYGVGPASQLPALALAISTGLLQPPGYQPCGYSYGFAPASQLPAMPMAISLGWPQPPSYQFSYMPMAIPVGWPQPPSHQLCLWLCSYGAQASQ